MNSDQTHVLSSVPTAMGAEAKRLEEGQRCRAGWDGCGLLRGRGTEKGMSLVAQRARASLVGYGEVATSQV